MTTLTFDIVFDFSDEELRAVYDQTERIKKALDKAVMKESIGQYLKEIVMYG